MSMAWFVPLSLPSIPLIFPWTLPAVMFVRGQDLN